MSDDKIVQFHETCTCGHDKSNHFEKKVCLARGCECHRYLDKNKESKDG